MAKPFRWPARAERFQRRRPFPRRFEREPESNATSRRRGRQLTAPLRAPARAVPGEHIGLPELPAPRAFPRSPWADSAAVKRDSKVPIWFGGEKIQRFGGG